MLLKIKNRIYTQKVKQLKDRIKDKEELIKISKISSTPVPLKKKDN
jgi:hypothetical protein